MSKKKKKSVKINVSVDTNDNNSDKIVGDKLLWEDLITQKEDIVKTLIGQQIQVHELTKVHSDIINNDKELLTSIKGVMLSLKDLANDINETSRKHETVDSEGNVNGHKRGNVTLGGDDEIEYIRITGEYITISEKIAFIASTAFLDIFTRLKVNDAISKELKDVIVKGNNEIAKERETMSSLVTGGK